MKKSGFDTKPENEGVEIAPLEEDTADLLAQIVSQILMNQLPGTVGDEQHQTRLTFLDGVSVGSRVLMHLLKMRTSFRGVLANEEEMAVLALVALEPRNLESRITMARDTTNQCEGDDVSPEHHAAKHLYIAGLADGYYGGLGVDFREPADKADPGVERCH